MGPSRKLFLALIFTACAGLPLIAAKTAYSVIDLGGLSGTGASIATAMNGSGQVVGKSASHAFLWSNGVMTDLGTLGGSLSMANAINDFGQIVGDSTTASGETHAFLWDHGVMKDLGIPGETSSAYGIDNQGDIVGAVFGKNQRGGAVLWKNGVRQSLGDLGPSGSGSTAIAINKNGEIAGVSSGFAANSGVVRAVVWQSGVIQDIGTLGGLHSTANALNDKGDVVGWSQIADQTTDPFIWQAGAMRDLGRLPGSMAQPGSGSQAVSINVHGQVVGSSLDSTGASRAVIWEGGQIIDLNNVIPRTSGLTLTQAVAVNGQGQIVVVQKLASEGTAKSFVLNPQ